MRAFLKFCLLFWTTSIAALASTTVTINVASFTGGTSPGASIRIDLQNCAGAQVTGTGQIVPQSQTVYPVAGVSTVTLFSNSDGAGGGQIQCQTNTGLHPVSYYSFNFIYQGVITAIGSYNLLPGTYQLSNLTPCVGPACIQPSGGIGGGVSQIIAGTNVTISSTGPAGTGAVTVNASGSGGGGSFGICDAQTIQTNEQNGITNCYALPAVQTIAGPDYPNTEPPFYGPNFTRLQDLRGGHVINVQHGSPNGTGVLYQNLFNTQTSPQNNGFFSPSSQVTTAEGFGNGNGFAGGQSAISNVQYPIGGSVYCYFIGLCSANATVQTWAGSEDHIGSPGYSYIYHGAPCVGSGRECDKWGAGNYFEFPLVGVGTVDSVVSQTRIHLTPCQNGKCTGGQEIAGGVIEDLDDTINTGLITALENYGSYPASFISSVTHPATPNYMQTITTLAPAQVAVPGSPQVVTLTRSVSQVTATAGSGQTPGTYTVNGTGGGGTGAQIAVTVDATGIVSSQVRVMNSGQNYTSAPTFAFSHGGTPSTFTVSVGGYLPTSGEACVIGKEHYEENVYSSAGPITGFSISGNVLTATSILGIQTGDTFTLSGFPTSTYLNGQLVTVSGITSSVSGITLGFGGSGGSGQTPGTYLVTGTGGGGSGAQVSIVVGANGQVNTDPTIVNPGSGYTSAPTFTVGAGGVGATFFVSLLANQFTAPFTHANVASRVEAGIFTLPAATGGHQEIVLTSRYSNSVGSLILPGSLVAINLEAEKHFLQFSGLNSWPYYLSCNAGPDTSHVWYSFPDGSTDAEGILGIVGSGIPVDSAFIFPPQTMSGINITSIPSTGVSKVAINFGGGGSISGKYTLDVTGGGGSGAIVTAIVTADGNIQAPPVVVNPGTGYTSTPTFTLPAIASGFTATFFVTLGGSQVTATLPFFFVGSWLQGAPSSSVASCADGTVNYTNQAASLNVTNGGTTVTWITPTAHADGTTTGCTIAVTGQNGYEMHPMADVLSITNPDIAPGFNPADPDYHPEIDGTLMLAQNLMSLAGKSVMLPHAPRVAITHTQTFNQVTPGPTNFQSIVLDAGTVSGLNPINWQCVTCDPTQFVGGGGFRPPAGTLMTTSSIPFVNYFHVMAPVLSGTLFQVDAPLGNRFDDHTFGIFRFAGAGNFNQADISYNPGTNRLSAFADWFDVRGFGIDVHGGEIHNIAKALFQDDNFQLHYLGNGNVFGETDFSGGPGVWGAGFHRAPSTGGFQWASALIDTNPDTQISRPSAGLVSFDTTAQGDGLGRILAASASFTGAGFPVGSGSASNTDLVGELTFAAATTATYTFTSTGITTHPVCTPSPEATTATAGNPFVTYTGVASFTINFPVAFTGTVGYICIGRN